MAKNIKDFDDFIDQLIKEKSMDSLDSEVLGQVKRDLSDRIEERVNATIMENMPPEKLEEFERLLDSGNSDEISAYCRAAIPDLDALVASSLLSFRQIYLGL